MFPMSFIYASAKPTYQVGDPMSFVLVRVLAKRKRPEAATAREVLPGAEGQEGAALGARLLGGAGVKRFGVKRVSLWAMVKKQVPFLGVGMVMNLIFCGVGVGAM